MRVAILLNRDRAAARALAKRALSLGYDLYRGRLSDAGSLLLPEYDSFARLLDEKPLFLGLDGEPDLARIRECDLLIWEWGWSAEPVRRLLQIRDKVEIPTLVFPGPLDLFWRAVSPADIPMHVEAGKRTHLVGVMSSDFIPFYRDLLPHARVFHMPTPVDVERLAAMGGESVKDADRVMLTAPTSFAGGASQLPITTMLAFRSVATSRPSLRGVAYAYMEDELLQCASILKTYDLDRIVTVQTYVRPIQRFIEQIRTCNAALFLSNGNVQGRMAMLCACIGIPMVAGDHVEAHRRLFPETLTPWYDTARGGQLLEQLLDDSEFRSMVVRVARQKVEMYSPEKVRASILAEFNAFTQAGQTHGKVG